MNRKFIITLIYETLYKTVTWTHTGKYEVSCNIDNLQVSVASKSSSTPENPQMQMIVHVNNDYNHGKVICQSDLHSLLKILFIAAELSINVQGPKTDDVDKAMINFIYSKGGNR